MTRDDDIYDLMGAMGRSSEAERFYQLRDKGRVSLTSVGSKLVAEGAHLLLKELRKYHVRKTTRTASRRVRQLISDIGPSRAAALSLQVLLDRVAGSHADDPPTIQAMQTFLGERLRDEMEFLHLSRLQPGRYGFVQRKLENAKASFRANTKRHLYSVLEEGQEVPVWDRADVKMIGGCMVDMAMRYTGLFKIERRWMHPKGNIRRKAKVHNIIRLTDAVFQWMIDSVEHIAQAHPTLLQITTPPLDWGPGERGGYHRQMPGSGSLMTAVSFDQRKALEESDCPELYKAVNTLQRTPWRVNKKVLEVARIALKHGWPDMELPVDPGPKPVAPDKEYDKEDPDWLAYRRAKTEWNHHQDYFVTGSLRAARTMAVADVFENEDRFFFPHLIDFRGRCYPVGSPLHYQGPDFQRGMLEFADGKPIHGRGAVLWFHIHGANCFGEDKIPFLERCDWVDAHQGEILASAEDPVANRWWTEADKPFQFLAWCFEYAQWLVEQEDFISHLPIGMDGSNNGLQIYSLLLRDEVGGRATNCVPSARVADVYMEVADVATEKLHEFAAGAGTAKQQRRAKQVLEFCRSLGHKGLPRKAVKRPVMTLPYGATLYGCQRYLCLWYHDYVRGKNLSPEEAPFPEGDSYKIFTWVGTVVWDAISEVVVKAIEAMGWFHEVAETCARHKVHVGWTTPVGLRVEQRYKKGEIRKIELRAGGTVRLRVWEELDEINARSSKNGLCPNFIHSLDSAAMMKTVNLAAEEGVTHFRMIHDDFACHAIDAPVMARALREAYHSIFVDTDHLKNLRDALQERLPEDVVLPEPPAHGELNINQLVNADYFYA